MTRRLETHELRRLAEPVSWKMDATRHACDCKQDHHQGHPQDIL
jgi:hypothetical protein